ncbi:SRPBCC family protein [Micromonospora craterilacus]|uniref:SRPBCC family protein n=1 Tax=Micromonospora craterilacus TaxID=1655439 RepID=UPI0013143511|nr:SRPBCC family protein [Micromonospora craterilacus]
MTDLNNPVASGQPTERVLGQRSIPAGEARSIIIRQRYDAPIEEVWSACTDPNRINRWFIEPKGDLRQGGTFALQGNAHGDILRCEPPRRLTLGWIYGDKPDSEVELRLSEEGTGTLLELEHATVSDEMLVEVAVGWEMALDFLGMFLRGDLSGGPIPEDAAAEFEPSPEMMRIAQERAETWAALVSSGS